MFKGLIVVCKYIVYYVVIAGAVIVTAVRHLKLFSL